MHSFWQRLNALFFYTLSYLGFLAFAAAGTTYLHQPDPRINLSLKKIMLCAASQFICFVHRHASCTHTPADAAAAAPHACLAPASDCTYAPPMHVDTRIRAVLAKPRGNAPVDRPCCNAGARFRVLAMIKPSFHCN